ncbi:hypothetical protein CO540_24970 [Micromonospora sp. WMMA2032]|uniref:hypothetical protein n=1 Tax=Micromonospora sp. WMMA2032 TaxID=2039870 RepID=UPI000C05C9D0|nr:hypothetical protein [Micromonospora sp. WMMA2032]ATO16696.1 hypothetical protein CO540_24970 [Micromonospora sp. WMMA2032]
MAEPGTRAAEAAADRGWRLRHLPVLLAAVAVVAAVAAVAGGVWRGADGALGAAAGVAVTAASYTLTTVVLAWADARDPQLVLPFGLGLYVAKMTALGGVMVLVASTGWPGLIPFCVGVAAGVVVWTGVHIWWLATVHARRQAR